MNIRQTLIADDAIKSDMEDGRDATKWHTIPPWWP